MPDVDGSANNTYDYTWDILGRLEELKLNTTTPLLDNDFLGAGTLVEATYGDGSRWTMSDGAQVFVDGAGRRTEGRIYLGTASSSAVFHEIMRYDARDRVLSVEWPHGRTGGASEAQEYVYDELGQHPLATSADAR